MIVDQNKDGKWVNDSWEIAKYLEKTYPDQPSLFKGTSGKPPSSECGCPSLQPLAAHLFKLASCKSACFKGAVPLAKASVGSVI